MPSLVAPVPTTPRLSIQASNLSDDLSGLVARIREVYNRLSGNMPPPGLAANTSPMPTRTLPETLADARSSTLSISEYISQIEDLI